ncbi:hypothetical protein HYH03_015870 [Edaphochlamys debaryana]|uniref:Uncharacterized protein n=1 Tax=Edaphochlamys debaryana TaxID=47281 RepID=A0A836BS61_9CHLO|nr:hypothetical protein HYH03_015870 [Edaphochlamys debaryana]|eukprot:KAG2485383.1 hypothetical protein HYH03_015870 [Edaphochlamys debaryana]
MALPSQGSRRWARSPQPCCAAPAVVQPAACTPSARVSPAGSPVAPALAPKGRLTAPALKLEVEEGDTPALDSEPRCTAASREPIKQARARAFSADAPGEKALGKVGGGGADLDDSDEVQITWYGKRPIVMVDLASDDEAPPQTAAKRPCRRAAAAAPQGGAATPPTVAAAVTAPAPRAAVKREGRALGPMSRPAAQEREREEVNLVSDCDEGAGAGSIRPPTARQLRWLLTEALAALGQHTPLPGVAPRGPLLAVKREGGAPAAAQGAEVRQEARPGHRLAGLLPTTSAPPAAAYGGQPSAPAAAAAAAAIVRREPAGLCGPVVGLGAGAGRDPAAHRQPSALAATIVKREPVGLCSPAVVGLRGPGLGAGARRVLAAQRHWGAAGLAAAGPALAPPAGPLLALGAAPAPPAGPWPALGAAPAPPVGPGPALGPAPGARPAGHGPAPGAVPTGWTAGPRPVPGAWPRSVDARLLQAQAQAQARGGAAARPGPGPAPGQGQGAGGFPRLQTPRCRATPEAMAAIDQVFELDAFEREWGVRQWLTHIGQEGRLARARQVVQRLGGVRPAWRKMGLPLRWDLVSEAELLARVVKSADDRAHNRATVFNREAAERWDRGEEL